MKRLLVRASLLVSLLLMGCGKYEEFEREVGYKGLAKLNRFLAAERFAQEMGFEASSYAGAPTLPPKPGATIIIPAEALQSVGQLEEMSEWVIEGGNLIAYLTVAKNRVYQKNPKEEEPFQAFLDYFGFESLVRFRDEVDEVDEESELTKTNFLGEKVEKVFLNEGQYETDFRTSYFLVDSDDLEAEASPVCTYDYGDGSLTVFGSAELFTNRSIGKAEHASLLWEVLSDGKNETVWLIHSTRLSFFGLLWQKASYAVTLLLISVTLLIWWASRGFGPKFVRGTNPTARLDEHLEASGSFFRKHNAEVEVIRHQREKILRRLARVTNEPLNLSLNDLIQKGQQQGFIERQEVAALVETPDKKTLLTTLQTLKNLEQKL